MGPKMGLGSTGPDWAVSLEQKNSRKSDQRHHHALQVREGKKREKWLLPCITKALLSWHCVSSI